MPEAEKNGQVVLVGHCVPDEWMLRTAVQRALPEVVIVAANDDAGIDEHMTAGSLLLVNRVLDGDFANTSGLDVIDRASKHGAKAMLVSNFQDAQSTARASGAHEGFGKSEVNHPKTMELVKAAHRS